MTKICFIISTIGADGSPERERANEKFDYLFKPVLDELGYESIRADKEDVPGSISRKIVERIIHSEIVIADISDHNTNVFYELAVRNAVNKPVILIKTPEQKPPFDIQDTRAISVDMSKPKIWQLAKEQLKRQIQDAEKNPEPASQSILSDFTFQIETKKKDDVLLEILRNVKDLQGSLNRTRTPNERHTVSSLRVWSISYSALDDAKKPDWKEKQIMYLVQCKTCNEIYQIPLSNKIDVSKKITLNFQCPECNSNNVLFEKDLMIE